MMLDLTQVTLCAATSVNVAATVRALQCCMRMVRYARVLLFTDDHITAIPPGVERIVIPRLRSTSDYSLFLLRDLGGWIETMHCLIVQWDGFVLNPDSWESQFLKYDYIGAPWPQFEDGHDVGNGGFSLRSRRLLDACQDPRFRQDGRAEDLTIARSNRVFLEQNHAIRFADKSIAARFSHERPFPKTRALRSTRASWVKSAFGFHGAFNMVQALGPRAFGEIYRSLDHKGTVSADLWLIVRQLLSTRGGRRLALEILQSEVGLRLRSSGVRNDLG